LHVLNILDHRRLSPSRHRREHLGVTCLDLRALPPACEAIYCTAQKMQALFCIALKRGAQCCELWDWALICFNFLATQPTYF
jgi:hypothetical protein